MHESFMIETPRLLLRPWRDEDLKPFAILNQDKEVMEFMPSLLTLEESTVFAQKIAQHFERYGFGLFAVEVKDSGEFIGYVGLKTVEFQAHFTPAMEIGWRLARSAWGKGYATEAAKAVLAKAFDEWQINEIVSLTTVQNVRSRQVMERLGMTYDPKDDFDHPMLAKGHPLSRHVLYRIRKEFFVSGNSV
jgi:RimJ/RimL family protein N-acetyltransferase